jgi:hypothetical protein
MIMQRLITLTILLSSAAASLTRYQAKRAAAQSSQAAGSAETATIAPKRNVIYLKRVDGALTPTRQAESLRVGSQRNTTPSDAAAGRALAAHGKVSLAPSEQPQKKRRAEKLAERPIYTEEEAVPLAVEIHPFDAFAAVAGTYLSDADLALSLDDVLRVFSELD